MDKRSAQKYETHTRKLMTMQKAFDLKDFVDKIYITRKEGRSGLASIEDCVDVTNQELEEYTEHSRD